MQFMSHHHKAQRGLNKKSGFTTSTFAQRRGPNAANRQQNGSEDGGNDENNEESEYREFGPFVEGEDFEDYDDADVGVEADPRAGQGGLMDDDDDDYDNTEEVSGSHSTPLAGGSHESEESYSCLEPQG